MNKSQHYDCDNPFYLNLNISQLNPLKHYMSAKRQACREHVQAGRIGAHQFQIESESIDITPKKRPNPQASEGLYNLSPFPLPPKFNYATGHLQPSVNHDLKIIETPIHKTTPKFIHNSQDIDEISKKIIWEPNSNEMSPSEESKDDGMDQDDDEEEEEDQIESQQNSENQMESEESEQDQSAHLREMQLHHQQEKQKKAHYKNKTFQFNPQKDSQASTKKIFCNCKKTKCLKLYCDCFRLNQTCEGCNCVGCHNLQIYNDERNNAIMVLMDRNPDPFGQKIQADKHVKGCNCKKSNCLKKYCQCYQAGLKCGQNCKCQECKNNEEKDPHDKTKGTTAKKQKRMVEI